MENTYGTGATITGVLTFIIVWIYALMSWGFLLGLVFGWIPALIAAFIAAVLWPVVAVLLGILALLILTHL